MTIPRMPVHGDNVPCSDLACRVRPPRHTGDAVLPGDDGTVDEHTPPSFHDSRRKGDHKGHSRIYGIAHKDLSLLKIEKVRGVQDDPRFSHCHSGSCGLTEDLPRLEEKIP